MHGESLAVYFLYYELLKDTWNQKHLSVFSSQSWW